MVRRLFLSLAAASVAAVMVGLPCSVNAMDNTHRISEPVVHENLAIYFIHGAGGSGPVPLTLAEALEKGTVRVNETGQVNELSVENLGDEEIYIQSGDIVKGGQQDRVLTVSLVIPAKSGQVPIASYCVEQGRWARRGAEEAAHFSAAESALPSRAAKLAMKAPPTEVDGAADLPIAASDDTNTRQQAGRGRSHADNRLGYADTGSRQQAMWDSVRVTQDKLSRAFDQSVRSKQSESSLQLSLEHDDVVAAVDTYTATLQGQGERTGDIVGFAFAINGKLNSADLYPSNGLFRKLWPKLLKASITEAIGEKGETVAALPSTEQVRTFLADAEKGRSTQRALNAGVALETRDADKALYFETTRAGSWMHRNYISK